MSHSKGNCFHDNCFLSKKMLYNLFEIDLGFHYHIAISLDLLLLVPYFLLYFFVNRKKHNKNTSMLSVNAL